MKKLLEEKILILDGAMGTSIQDLSLTEEDFRGERFKDYDRNLKGCNELLNITKPEVISDIYRLFLEAGADIIETNTFNGNILSMDDYNLSELAYELSYEGARLARIEADKFDKLNNTRTLVAGAMGPLNKSGCISTTGDMFERDIEFDELLDIYGKQVEALMDGGVDAILIETIFDGLNAKAAVIAAEEVFEKKNKQLPIMISSTVDNYGKLLSGQSIESLVAAVDRDSIVSFGLNCSFGAKGLIPIIKRLAEFTDKAISIYPNAGLPNELGEYDEAPEMTASLLGELIDNQILNIVGGCCGTTYAHIAAIAKRAEGKKPRPLSKEKSHKFLVAGDDVLEKEGFLAVGERNNVAGSRKFARLIKEEEYQEALFISIDQVKKGANIIDINLDDGLLDSVKEMKKFIRVLMSSREVSSLPFMLDSSDFDVIKMGLKNIAGKPIVNSISLKSGEEDFLEKAKLVKKYGAALVVMAFDETGQASEYEHKIEIAKRSYDLLMGINFRPEDIIFDMNILTVGTGDSVDRGYGLNYIKAVKWINENLPYAKSVGGLSNISFAFRGNNPLRHAINKIFLDLGIENGLKMAIMNPSEKTNITDSLREKVEALLLNKRDVLEELLNEHVEKVVLTKEEVAQLTDEEFIINCLVDGTNLRLIETTDRLLEKYKPIEIIQDILMEGMGKVGELFETGKLFLPQIVKSASIMKLVVAHLTPLLESDATVEAKETIVMATVNGDVHDIGKNIVRTVLQSNGYNVIDLGVMVDRNLILETAIKHKASGVTLSGLITPSLKEMEEVAKLFNKNNMEIPIFVGGAATSKLHTALKIQQHYDKKVFHLTDASNTVVVLDRIFGGDQEYIDNINDSYEKIRQAYKNNAKKGVDFSLEKARTLKQTFDNKHASPTTTEIIDVDITIEKIKHLIDWNLFLHNWNVKGTEKEAEILEDGKKFLKKLEESNLKIQGRYRFLPIRKDGDVIYVDDIALPMARTQRGDTTLSLADFVDENDHIGFFIGSLEDRTSEDEYEKIMYKLILNRLAEATSIYLDQHASRDHKVYIRPAIGYPILPDHSMKKEAFDILDAWSLGIDLTDTFVMNPTHTVCGLYFLSPSSKYFQLVRMLEDQVEYIAKYRNKTVDQVKDSLGIIV